jgi:hypothetical protein
MPQQVIDQRQINGSPHGYHLDRDRIRTFRLVAGYGSDEALARAAGLSYGHFWCCLSGRRVAGSKVLAGLLRALPGATLCDLVVPPVPVGMAVTG